MAIIAVGPAGEAGFALTMHADESNGSMQCKMGHEFHSLIFKKKKNDWLEPLVLNVKPKKVSGSHLVGTTLRPYRTC